ncbi:hypothetical protein JOM56_004783 [Amanita muscaria]
MLKKFVEQSRDENTLQCYAIAACLTKILHRMKHPISITYLDSLKSVSNFEFVEQVDNASRSPTMNANDKAFFFDILPNFPMLLKSKLPRLIARAAERVPEIYTKDTCIEFHILLCDLLRFFLVGLELLNECRSQRPETSEVMNRLASIVPFGVALQTLARGHAIKKHLKVIEPLLRRDEPRKDGGENGDGDGLDPELQGVRPFAIQQGKPLPLWNAYRDWVQLMVTHFDAVQVLVRYLCQGDQTPRISFKILCSPKPGEKMLPWKELLHNHDYFLEIKSENGLRPPSVDELIEFLTPDSNPVAGSIEDNVNVKLVIKAMKEVTGMSSSTVEDRVAALDDVIADMKYLDACTSLGCIRMLYAKNITEKMKYLKENIQHDPQLSDAPSIPEIIEMLETLEKNVQLHNMLKQGSKLSRGTGFKGRQHCELSLATLISISGKPRQNNGLVGNALLDKIAEYGLVLGVSKRCCPVCAHVLAILKSKDERPFIFKGHHSTVTACTLPEWLPKEVINKVVSEFGGRLRRELVKLKQRTEIVRARTHSVDSRRLSVDSMEPPTSDVLNANTWQQADGLVALFFFFFFFRLKGWIDPK